MNDSVVQSSVMSKRVVTQSWVTSVIMEPKPMVSQTHCMMSASKMCHPMMTHAHTMLSNSIVSKPNMTQTHPMVSNSMVPNPMVANTNPMVSMACSKMDNWVSTSMHCMMDRLNMLDHWFWMHYMVVLMHMHKGLEGRQVLLGVSKGWHGVGGH